jgi:hypothetical protein
MVNKASILRSMVLKWVQLALRFLFLQGSGPQDETKRPKYGPTWTQHYPNMAANINRKMVQDSLRLPMQATAAQDGFIMGKDGSRELEVAPRWARHATDRRNVAPMCVYDGTKMGPKMGLRSPRWPQEWGQRPSW